MSSSVLLIFDIITNYNVYSKLITFVKIRVFLANVYLVVFKWFQALYRRQYYVCVKMPEICCVDGCVPAKDDVTYFKFPNSRALRRKWLDAIPSTSIKVTLDTVVCSRHFLAEQYEVVRQKRRLKAKVVPSVFDQIKTPTAKDDELISSKQTDTANGRVASDVTTDNKPDAEQRTTSPNHRLQENTCKNESCMTNGLKEDIVKRSQPDNVSITDSEISNKDIEDIITNYQIKQTRPVHQGTETETGGNRETGGSTLAANACIEVEVPPFAGEIQVERNDKIEIGRNGEMEIGKNGEIQMRREEASQVIDVDDEAEPVFIEVSVGKAPRVAASPTKQCLCAGGDQDCVMLLESVQCDVDPRCLVLPERAPASPPAR
ncbi:jg5619 [Pararge aegeria aegeria]|uniref:Jg5619 protein n=1 Tax=Pararge aegeria aegeria TaxID=348720 RepID=A0A8S4SIC5_9NEOP|nr:jg5619 [Pararge aegeria aegeria]